MEHVVIVAEMAHYLRTAHSSFSGERHALPAPFIAEACDGPASQVPAVPGGPQMTMPT
jgi:hypothetical protein